MTRTPQAIVVIIVWCYWLSVLLLLIRSRIKFRASGGAVPKTKRERWMWLVWVPTVVLWQVLPILAYRSSLPLIAAPQWAVEHPNAIVDWLAVLAAWRRVFPGLSADEDALAGRVSCHDCPRDTLCSRLNCDAGNTKPNHNRTT